ncbi:hypothetical protein BDV28DRAFT_144532 [Aspergillus coremiiformis]|uniref:Uncharacterized protein n=1 Tax=Aspergillus coremiiformis TaxID=138285 RepID=A0A5N6YSX5_9EURO|nr:hypothetical protein BDV28DRAFT_144532 [Aspergillus coremiiformis]
MPVGMEDPNHWAAEDACKGTDPSAFWSSSSRDGIVLLMFNFTVCAGITAPHVIADSRLRVPNRKCQVGLGRTGDVMNAIVSVEIWIIVCVCVCMCMCMCECVCATGSDGKHPEGGISRVSFSLAEVVLGLLIERGRRSWPEEYCLIIRFKQGETNIP